MPRKLAEAHPEDKAELAIVLNQSVQRNTGAEVGTGSGPTDLQDVIAEAVANDDVAEPPVLESEIDYGTDSEEEDQEVQEESEGGRTNRERGKLEPR